MKTEDIKLEEGKYYHVKYRWKGNEFEDFGAYQGFEFNSYYFRDDKGDFMILSANQILSLQKQTT